MRGLILYAVVLALTVAGAAEVGTKAAAEVTKLFAPIEKAFKDHVS